MRNIFKRKQQSPPEEVQAEPEQAPQSEDPGLPTVVAQVCQSVGKTRSHNEDAVYALITDITTPSMQEKLGLFVVADGMGGHLDGEVASSLAIKTAVGHILNGIFEPLCLEQPAFSAEAVEHILDEAVQAAQQAVLSEVEGGGTTLTVAMLIGRRLTYAHVGDSRLYLAAGQEPLRALTKDHSLVSRLVDLGQISPEEAASHPQRNVLFRAIGQVDGFKADLGTLELPETSALLLCSDGLWGLVDEETIGRTLRSAHQDPKTADALVEAANAAGGTDNISAIVVTIA